MLYCLIIEVYLFRFYIYLIFKLRDKYMYKYMFKNSIMFIDKKWFSLFGFDNFIMVIWNIYEYYINIFYFVNIMCSIWEIIIIRYYMFYVFKIIFYINIFISDEM